MAHQVDKLVKVGLEGFALLDEAYGRKKKPAGSRDAPTNYNNPQQNVYRGPQVITVWEQVMDSNQAAQFYGDLPVVDHNMRKPISGVY